MKSNLLWKVVLVLVVLAWTIAEQYPWKGQNLLKAFESSAVEKDDGFAKILETVAQLDTENPGRDFGNLYMAAGTNDLKKYFPNFKIEAGGKDSKRSIISNLQKKVAGQMRLGLDLQGGTSFQVEMDLSKIEGDTAKESAVIHGIEILRKRLDRFGVSEPIIVSEGGNRIRIDMPGLAEADRESVIKTLQQAAFLEFRMVHEESARLLSEEITAWPGYEFMEQIDEDEFGVKTVRPYLVKKKVENELTGKHVTRAYVYTDLMGQPEVHLEFDSEGADKFDKITSENQGRQLGIVLDGALYSAPNLNERISSGRASISGQFTYAEAFSLANALENPLEAPVAVIGQRGVDPSLGADSIKSGLTATLIGLIAVAVFMLVYYLLAGVIANVALALNIIILLGIFCSIDATLTLPGIAGILLTVGMAVDANVLIFERIREELAAGKSLKGAVKAGYGKAFSTIFDANITTLIASVILIKMGTGPVKGFGITLTIGILASMFTALFVSRIFFDFMLDRGLLKNLKMLNVFGNLKIKFLDWSKPAFIVSWIIVLVGSLYGFSRGSDVFGVEFKGGDYILYEFAEKVDVDEIRPAIAEAAKGGTLIQYQKDLSSGLERLSITSAFETGLDVEKALKAAFPDSDFKNVGAVATGPQVSREILRAALVAMLLALFGILVYVAFRYEFSFAVGAVVAVLHDVFMTLGIFCMVGGEFTAPMVAAILTIVGFSINDTIVIFDRIREYLKLGMGGSFKDIMNYALNKTFARTIITSGTLFLAVVALYIFGGGVIHDFAFTLIVGVITGTYSSIYIAGSLVLWWHKGSKPKLATNTTATIDVAQAAA